MDGGENPIIFVTGFGPFGSHAQNASQVIVDLLPSTDIESELNVKLHTEILAVSYENIQNKVPVKWNKLQPKLVVHIGVSDGVNGITLERRAFNDNYCQLDISGCLPCSNICIKENPSVLETTLDLKKAVSQLQKMDTGLKYSLSSDPGRYLCGFVYYTSLSIDRCRTVFIHIPPLTKVSHNVDQAVTALLNSITCVIKVLYKQV